MIRAVQKDLADHKEEVAKVYVPKVDYRDDIKRIFDKLDQISNKLDGKADRHRTGD